MQALSASVAAVVTPTVWPFSVLTMPSTPTACVFLQTSTQRRHLTHLFGSRRITSVETSGSKSCCCGSNGSALTPNSRASACSSQKPSRTQSHQKQFSQIAGSRSSMREPPVRAQWWQSTVC